MPAKFRVKNYVRNGIYHIYNGGIDDREVFRDPQDFEKFESVLAKCIGEYEKPLDGVFRGLRPSYEKHKKEMNMFGQVELLTYCLMPSHIHLLVRQKGEDGITKLMRRVMTEYVMWNNRKYARHGQLFENV